MSSFTDLSNNKIGDSTRESPILLTGKSVDVDMN
jgi:hypothetical protein